MDDLKARLRKQVLRRITRMEGIVTEPINPDGNEAATRIEELETENERLLNALEHYAEPRSATLSDNTRL